MIIKNAPRQLLYADPHQFIRKEVLPLTTTCGKCESELILEMESDLYATKYKGEWALGFLCIVCGSKRVWTIPSAEAITKEREKERFAQIPDEEYQETRARQIATRTEMRKKYLSYGTREAELASRGWINDHRYGTNEKDKYIEEKFLPEVYPAEKPMMNGLTAFYEEVLEHYVKQAAPVPKLREVQESMPKNMDFLDVAWPTMALVSFFAILAGAFMGSFWLIGVSVFWLLYSGTMIVERA